MTVSLKNHISNYIIGILLAVFCLPGLAAPVAAIADTADTENILWVVVQKKNTGEGFDAYLAQYPEGKFTGLAKMGINKLKIEQAVREEAAAWKVVQDSEDIKAIQQFLAKYPNGANAITAKARVVTVRKVATEFKPGQAFKGCATCPEMVILPAGSFMMGEAKNVRRVTFSVPFAIGKKEVTQKEWIAVMGTNPSKFKECIGNCPVDNISWEDAKEFVRRLNIKTGKEYRLPSEAEWEYACRAGMQQAYCGSDDVNSVAWSGIYSTSTVKASRATMPVAIKKANAWGLYDMTGNVAEWTEDGYHENFAGAPVDGSAWQGDGRGYVLRGGSWEGSPERVRAVNRDFDGPSNRDVTYGFRVARKFP